MRMVLILRRPRFSRGLDFSWTMRESYFMLKYMLHGIRIFSSDAVWSRILSELGAVVVDSPESADVNLDEMNLAMPVAVPELKVLIMNAAQNDGIIRRVCGDGAVLPRGLGRVVTMLYKSGGMSAAELKTSLGYSPDAATHAIEAAIYQLRKMYGRDFIKNKNGMYYLGKL